MGKAKSIVIAGGGVIGLSTAYYAMQRGHHVTLLERGTPNHDCCSLGNAGIVVPSHFIPLAAPGMVALGLKMMWNPRSPFFIRPRLNAGLARWCWAFYRAANAAHVRAAAPVLLQLNLASRALFEQLSARFDFGFTKRGLLILCQTERMLQEEAHTAEVARELGLSPKLLTAQEAAALEPNVRMEIAGAIEFPSDCHLNPAQFVATLTKQLETGGVDLRWETEVTGWKASGNRITEVRTSRGNVPGEEFVAAGGSWSSRMLDDLGLRLPLEAGKGYSLTLQNATRRLTRPAILAEARVAVTPMGQAMRFGGTMELAGLDQSINEPRIQGIVSSVRRFLPDFTAEELGACPPWSGLRPCSPDGLPYVGRFKRYANLSTATGHAMMGLSLGPITGHLMAQILSDEKPDIGLEMMQPDRFSS